MTITTDTVRDYLNCAFKVYLRGASEQGIRSDYEAMRAKAAQELRDKATRHFLAQYPEGLVERGVIIAPSALSRGAAFILDAELHDDQFQVYLDGLKKVDGRSDLGDFHYLPVLFYEGRQIRKSQRLLLAALSWILGRVQGKSPDRGIIYHGSGCSRYTATTVRFTNGLKAAEDLFEALSRISRGEVTPKLLLNDHCQVCEFRHQCHARAVQEDNMSLLRGLGEKEIKGYGRKGLFTLTQLAHTFRPRRKGKRSDRRHNHRYHALQALAIRDKRVYVFGTPLVPTAPVRIYLDLEGDPEQGLVYLIGLIVCIGREEQRYSFWANSKDQESEIFERFLAVISRYNNPRIYCYGSYEWAFIKRMRRLARKKKQVDQSLAALVNTLSIVYAHVYFPTYSNGLKEVAGCLGFAWTDADASGVQSIAWRMRWERTHAEQWKDKLIRYNLEDCAALRRVTEFIQVIGTAPGLPAGQLGSDMTPVPQGTPLVTRVEELDRLGAVNRRGKIQFFHKDYQYINDCAHFDYQRQRVYLRTNKLLRKNAKKPRHHRNARLPVNQRVQIAARKCPSCGSHDVSRWEKGKRVAGQWTKHKRALDLVFTPSGIKRRVVECRTQVHQCSQCGNVFVPSRYKRLAKHYHGLMSWAMYEHVAHRVGTPMLSEMLREHFSLTVYVSELNEFKSVMARRYGPCCKRLFTKMLAGPVLHVDETQVRLRTGVAYVWVFTTAEEVVYMYRPTREGDFLPQLLAGFKGVLVTDFYAAYEALPCPQQKCLIHLMRDINQELLNNPFDQELQSITGPFGVLLRDVVATIDKHGLQVRHLLKHGPRVEEFFRTLGSSSFRSEAAEALRARLTKYQGKLFTFLAHDGVPWNNNNAENAIRQFAYYRDQTPGRLKEMGLKDYLTLLSVSHTCHYRSVSFLRFLLSRQFDIDAFCWGDRRERPRLSLVELYPRGIVRPDFVARRKKPAEVKPPGDKEIAGN